MVLQIIAILGGLIAASSLIASKSKEAGDLINKLLPFQGIFGLVLIFAGVANLIDVVSYFSIIIKSTEGIVLTVLVILCTIVGLILAFGLISKFVGGKEGALGKLYAKLLPFQIPLGVALSVTGLIAIVI